MATINGGRKPKSAFDIPEGDMTFKVVKMEGLPRANPTLVNAEFVNADGGKIKNKYDLKSDGGYAAFYYLMLNGYDIDLGDPDAVVDLDKFAGTFVELKVVHKPRENGGFFNNIGATVGPGEPFDTDEDEPVAAPAASDEDFD